MNQALIKHRLLVTQEQLDNASLDVYIYSDLLRQPFALEEDKKSLAEAKTRQARIQFVVKSLTNLLENEQEGSVSHG